MNMDRKDFVRTAAMLTAGSALPRISSREEEDKLPFRIPPYLRSGDIIGITSPAGTITPEQVQPAVQVMEGWGYRVAIGSSIGKKDFTFGGTDEERLTDMQEMLDNPAVKAIMCARGGYGSVRIVDRIDWRKFKLHPKWMIGFSDITVLHNHIHSNCGIATIHSKMTNSFPDNWNTAEPIQIETIISIQDALSGKLMRYPVTPNLQNRNGVCDGILVGGNLKTIESLSGSSSDINTDGKILFVEDTGEYLYSIDRMFWNLKRTGKLKKLKGLIVGGFKTKPDDEGEDFGKTVQQIVMEKLNGTNYPVCFDFPVGHQRANFALKCGVRHKLSVSTNDVSLKEMR